MIGYTQMDMGIAKLHFEIGAGKRISTGLRSDSIKLYETIALSHFFNQNSRESQKSWSFLREWVPW